MKLHLTTVGSQHLITAYDDASISINQQRHHANLIVMPDTLITDWHASTFNALTPEVFLHLATLSPEVVLLGTGAVHQFLHPKLYVALTDCGIPLECMTTAAACRTYNILMSEGRNVAAALLLR